jgi:dTDP-4-amino-4,6-dideoxygalactose transaminase
MYAGTRVHWSIDMWFWEAIRPLDPLPDDYHERFSNVQAAIALEGLAYIDRWTARTQQHANRLSAALKQVPGVRVPVVPDDRTHTFYQYCAYVPARDAIVDACLRRAVDIETLHVDVCTEIEQFGGRHAPTPGAQETTRTIQIPVYAALEDEQLDRIATVVADAVRSLGAEDRAAVHQS